MSEQTETLAYQRTNVYEAADEALKREIFSFAEGYKTFLDLAKTEREACAEVIKEAEAQGYVPFTFGKKLRSGDKVYYNNRGKNLYLIRVGTENLAENGVRIVASHIDSPRIDLKQLPLYEKEGIAFGKTHYYGGLRKYQWAAMPLALHGVVARKDGSVVNVCVGEQTGDPVFYISDLLPHLAGKAEPEASGTGHRGGGSEYLVWKHSLYGSFRGGQKDREGTASPDSF